ncbi:uncharacterized protein [Panulirus ornatus]|uniref:uncharacterized protein n=1 Tax=Panulirus ornatus TaxID=150431 RepID=UPI003A85987A
MTVWTDQSRTMERKLDILNRCHEKQETWEIRLNAVDALNHKLTALDKKINAMTRLEFKVEQVSERVEEVDSTVNWVKKQMNSPEAPIIREFAGRGVLSSLVQIEQKLDNMTSRLPREEPPTVQHNSYHRPRQVLGPRFRQVRPTVEAEPGIIFTTAYDESGSCQLHPRDARRLQDVSAKVDLLYDRLTDPEYEYDYFISHIHQRAAPLTGPTNGYNNGINGDNGDNGEEEPSPEHLFARFWKSIFSPFKKMKRRFRGFENQLMSVQRSCNDSFNLETYVGEVGGLLQRQLLPLDRTLRHEMELTRTAVNDQSARIEQVSQVAGSCSYVSEQLMAQVTSQVQQLHHTIHERSDETRSLIQQYCGDNSRRRDDHQPPPRSYPTTAAPTTSPPRPPPTTTPPPRPAPTTPPYAPPRPIPTTFPSPLQVVAGPPPDAIGRLPHRFRTRYRYRSQGEGPPVRDSLRRQLSQGRRRGRKRGSLLPRKISGRRGRGNRGSKPGRRVASHASTASALGRQEVKDCTDLMREGVTENTVFHFSPGTPSNLHQGMDFYTRYCDLETSSGGWTLVQRRGMFGPPYLNFTLDWESYKRGFGDIAREFWWGNENMYRLIQEQEVMIRFDLWDFEGNYAYAEYLSFSIGGEDEFYRLKVFGYRGNASDSFSAHNGYLFSTYDVDNDEAPECCPCAPAYGGGWWFYSCFESNLNGEYHKDPRDNDYYRGIIWELWLGDYSLRATEIKIRPLAFESGQGPGYPTPYPTPYTTPYPTDPFNPELPLRQP